MANKTIKMELSHKSIQDTIKQLRAYQKSLVSKNEEFVRRLAELGIPVKYIGVGETIEDLQKFDSNEFVNALFDVKDQAE